MQITYCSGSWQGQIQRHTDRIKMILASLSVAIICSDGIGLA